MKDLLNNEPIEPQNKKTNEIRIVINKPSVEVFEFTIEPNHKHEWCHNIEHEEVDKEQIGIGTVYTNNFGKLEITDYERNVYFELTDDVTQYQCSYSFRNMNDLSTEIIYFESMLDGSDLLEPMDEDYFVNLKEILEK